MQPTFALESFHCERGKINKTDKTWTTSGIFMTKWTQEKVHVKCIYSGYMHDASHGITIKTKTHANYSWWVCISYYWKAKNQPKNTPQYCRNVLLSLTKDWFNIKRRGNIVNFKSSFKKQFISRHYCLSQFVCFIRKIKNHITLCSPHEHETSIDVWRKTSSTCVFSLTMTYFVQSHLFVKSFYANY